MNGNTVKAIKKVILLKSKFENIDGTSKSCSDCASDDNAWRCWVGPPDGCLLSAAVCLVEGSSSGPEQHSEAALVVAGRLGELRDVEEVARRGRRLAVRLGAVAGDLCVGGEGAVVGRDRGIAAHPVELCYRSHAVFGKKRRRKKNCDRSTKCDNKLEANAEMWDNKFGIKIEQPDLTSCQKTSN